MVREVPRGLPRGAGGDLLRPGGRRGIPGGQERWVDEELLAVRAAASDLRVSPTGPLHEGRHKIGVPGVHGQRREEAARCTRGRREGVRGRGGTQEGSRSRANQARDRAAPHHGGALQGVRRARCRGAPRKLRRGPRSPRRHVAMQATPCPSPRRAGLDQTARSAALMRVRQGHSMASGKMPIVAAMSSAAAVSSRTRAQASQRSMLKLVSFSSFIHSQPGQKHSAEAPHACTRAYSLAQRARMPRASSHAEHTA